MENYSLISIEVAYANSKKQVLIPLVVPENTTVQTAIQLSKILSIFPEIDLNCNKVGIFGKLCTVETVLNTGDRVEIYRPLRADPKTVRQQRAKIKPDAPKVSHSFLDYVSSKDRR